MTIDTQEALRLLDEMHTAASSMGDCGDEHHYMPTIAEWRECWKYFRQNETELRALLSAKEGEPSAAEATPEMVDSVRYLIVALEMAGRTFKGVRQHCEWAGMDTSHWPDWTKGRDREHFNKAACAALIWHCMNHERLRDAEKEKGNG